MGWASGADIADDVWDVVKDYIPEKHKEQVARGLIEVFQNKDCGNIDEAEELWNAGNMPEYCYECDNEFPKGTLNEDGLCEPCKEKQ